jgi:hypothetical protein
MHATYRTHLWPDHCNQDWRRACIVKPLTMQFSSSTFYASLSHFDQHNILEHPVSLNLTVTIYMTKEIQAEENRIKFPTESNKKL